jgi:hypothetical protein
MKKLRNGFFIFFVIGFILIGIAYFALGVSYDDMEAYLSGKDLFTEENGTYTLGTNLNISTNKTVIITTSPLISEGSLFVEYSLETNKTSLNITYNEDTSTLNIAESKVKQEWYEYASIFHPWFADSSNYIITISVPLDTVFDNLIVESGTGNIKLTDIVVNEYTEIKNATGNVSLTNCSSSVLTINSSTGNISLKDVLIEDKAKIESAMGNITIVNSLIPDLIVESSTGNIDITNLVFTSLESNNSTGNFTLTFSSKELYSDVINYYFLSLSTSVGSNKLGGLSVSNEYSANTNSLLGKLKVVTSTGNININF